MGLRSGTEAGRLKVYHYTPRDCGLEQFPSGELRIAGEEVVPREAEIFVLPMILHAFHDIRSLPYFNPETEARHVFWNVGDDMDLWFDSSALFLRCDATQMILQHDPNTLGWPWPVEDMYQPHTTFDHDVVFQGWASTPLTHQVCESVQRTTLKVHIQEHDFFFGYHYYDPNYQHLKESFRQTLWHSRLSLVPRSIPQGVIRYRFYEAMSAGSVPVHLCDHCVLPFVDKINYNRCSIHIPETDADQTGEILTDWLSHHSDDEIVAMGEYGRQMWLRYLDARHWPDRFNEVVGDYAARLLYTV